MALASRTDLTHNNQYGGVSQILNANNDWDNYQTGGSTAISAESLASINALK